MFKDQNLEHATQPKFEEVSMKYTWIAFVLIGFAAGYVAHPAIKSALIEYFGLPPSRFPTSIKEHWKAVEIFRDSIRNPKDLKTSPEGFVYGKAPFEPISSLFALVDANELKYIDLVFPDVPYHGPATRFVLEWATPHEDIIHLTGNPGYGEFKTSGKEPLHLQIWFRESAKADVLKMIKDIEALQKE